MRFSASRLRLFMECGLAAHYRYDEGLPTRTNGKMLFGTCIHRALEIYNETDNYTLAVDTFKRDWAAADPDYWPRYTSYPELRTKGLDILEQVKESLRFADRTVLGAEVKFLVPFGEHELTGFVDLLELQRSGTGKELLRIVDYKTASKIPTKAALALDVQLSVYHYASTQREFWMGVEGNPEFPGLPNGEWLWETVGKMSTRRTIWYALWVKREIDAGPRTQKDFERLYRTCDEIKKGVEANVHIPKIGDACTYCDYIDPCALEIPVALKQLDDPQDPNRWI